MNDPLSPLQAPPPRYLLESDSSDEEGQGSYPHTSSSKGSRPSRLATPKIELRWSTSDSSSQKVREYETILLGVGSAGSYLARKFGCLPRNTSKSTRSTVELITNEKEVIGRGWTLSDRKLFFHIDEIEGTDPSVWAVAKTLLEDVRAESWTICTTYLPVMYIPSPSESLDSSYPPIRYLGPSPSGSAVARYDPPNYVSGLAAAIVSTASRTPSGTPARSFPPTILLPLPLSSIPSNSLSAVLGTISPLWSGLLEKSMNSPGTVWDEDDDVPYSGIGMGAKNPRGASLTARGETGGMYT